MSKNQKILMYFSGRKNNVYKILKFDIEMK